MLFLLETHTAAAANISMSQSYILPNTSQYSLYVGEECVTGAASSPAAGWGNM